MTSPVAVLGEAAAAARLAGRSTAGVRDLLRGMAAMARRAVEAGSTEPLLRLLAAVPPPVAGGEPPSSVHVSLMADVRQCLHHAEGMALSAGRRSITIAELLTSVLATQQLEEPLLAWLDEVGLLRSSVVRESLTCPAEVAERLTTLHLHRFDTETGASEMAQMLVADASVWEFDLDPLDAGGCHVLVSAPAHWALPEGTTPAE